MLGKGGQIYHTAKKVHFKKYGDLHSLEDKNNDAGIKFRSNTLVWKGLSIKVLINPKDDYAQMALLQTGDETDDQRALYYMRIFTKLEVLTMKKRSIYHVVS